MTFASWTENMTMISLFKKELIFENLNMTEVSLSKVPKIDKICKRLSYLNKKCLNMTSLPLHNNFLKMTMISLLKKIP